MKEQVLRYVESKGSARFTDIQKFIVDTKFGEGTYEAGAKYGQSQNVYRGYYSAAFTMPVGYFLKGANRLMKMENRKYCVIRESK